MAKYKIVGNKPLLGKISVVGAKNNCLKTIPATLMLDGVSSVYNVPHIEDLHRLVELMVQVGAKVKIEKNKVTVDPSTVTGTSLEAGTHQKTRVSVMLAAPLLHKVGEISFPYPGGCVLGKRPIDFFISGFRQFGVEVIETETGVTLKKPNKLTAPTIVFPRISHTATEAMMTFASKVPGVTTLINCAMEPEVVALADFLISCGAKISGAGTPIITVEGVEHLSGGEAHTIPDRMEAGSFAFLAAATGSNITIENINLSHLDVVLKYLEMANVKFETSENTLTILPSELKAIPAGVVTHEYPGFPTDLQAPFTVLMTQAQGSTLVHETIYEGRFFFTDGLSSMGANILMCDPHRVLVTGKTKLSGAKLTSPDIRAGMALVIAALCAKGETEIDNVYQIERGYENIVERLQSLGADIKRIE